ncbi:hypothetical protein C9439_04445 [archaeon SCG-AAA382B04]|nr:hypothetical protein C9439_04445 [archaeon SCG-AAA382B04]
MKSNKLSGLLLMGAGIINMLARIGIVIDVSISILLVISGYVAYECEERHEFAIIASLIGIGYVVIEFVFFYAFLPDLTGYTGQELLKVGAPFLSLVLLLSGLAFYYQLKLSGKKYPRF